MKLFSLRPNVPACHHTRAKLERTAERPVSVKGKEDEGRRRTLRRCHRDDTERDERDGDPSSSGSSVTSPGAEANASARLLLLGHEGLARASAGFLLPTNTSDSNLFLLRLPIDGGSDTVFEHEPGEVALGRHKLFVRSSLDDFSIFQDQHRGRLREVRECVSGEDDRLVLQSSANCLLKDMGTDVSIDGGKRIADGRGNVSQSARNEGKGRTRGG